MAEADSLTEFAKRLLWAWWRTGGNPERASVANANEAWDAFTKAGQAAWIAVARAAANGPQPQTNTALLGVLKNLAELASYAEIVGGVSVNRPGIRKWCDKAFDFLRVHQATPVRCPECGWCGHGVDLGPDGACGSGEECQGRPAAIVSQPDMIRAWADTDGMVCGPQLVALGLLEPDPGTAAEAREEWGAETLWRLSADGEAILRDARAQDALDPQLAVVMADDLVTLRNMRMQNQSLFQALRHLANTGRIVLQQPTATTPCKAIAWLSGANDPRDCNWPLCGCDPHADKVISALRDQVPTLHAGASPAPSAWRPIAETDKHGSPLLIGWLDSAGVWQARRAWWDPEFESEWDEKADDTRYIGAWTDGAVKHWGCQERVSYDPTHVAALPAPPPGMLDGGIR